MTIHDESAAREQLARADQPGLLRAIMNGSYDFSYPPTFRKREHGETMGRVAARTPTELIESVLEFCGNDRKYHDISHAVNTGLAMLVQYERFTGTDRPPDPFLIKLSFEQRQARRQAIADTINLFNDFLRNPNHSEKARDEAILNMKHLREAALADGNEDQVREIDGYIRLPIFMAQYKHAEREVNDAFNGDS